MTLPVAGQPRRARSLPASWTAANPADEHVFGNTPAYPPFLEVLKVNGVGQLRHGLVGCLGESCLSQQGD